VTPTEGAAASGAEQVVRVLLRQARCADCNCSYRSENVHVLRQQDDRIWDLAVVCHRCYTMSLVRAIVQGPAWQRRSDRSALPAVGPLHELDPLERAHFRALSPVSMDDVLDIAGFLADFDGDFQRLFQGRGGDP
jgi:hypothetical protein